MVEVNTVAGWGSTGRIAEQVGQMAVARGHEVWVAYGREPNRSVLPSIRIGSDKDMMVHGLQTRLLDRHGLASKRATRRFLDTLERDIKPDLVHLHNVHGYYLNFPLLFEWLRSWGGPVVWTLHDCWSFTGHCAYFDFAGCGKWRDGCHDCPELKSYPSASFWDNTKTNYGLKKQAWADMPSLTLVPVSQWLADLLPESIHRGSSVEVIKNGIDLTTFKPSGERGNYERPYVLGVASVWDRRKGMEDFTKLRKLLDKNIRIRLVGLTTKQIEHLPAGIEGIERTTDAAELARIYSGALAFVNPTYEDNYPTTNLEAQACGTPVVTYRTGGSPESMTNATGIVVEKGDVAGLAEAIAHVGSLSREACRENAVTNFDKDKAFGRYVDLFESLVKR